MIRTIRVPEFRFVVPGRAVSFRSPMAFLYKRKIRQRFRAALTMSPLEVALHCRLDYFHQHRRKFDMDNIAKCVLDALNGVAYVDDRLISLQSATAHDLNSRINLVGGPLDLVKPLRSYEEYLFVRMRLEQ